MKETEIGHKIDVDDEEHEEESVAGRQVAAQPEQASSNLDSPPASPISSPTDEISRQLSSAGLESSANNRQAESVSGPQIADKSLTTPGTAPTG